MINLQQALIGAMVLCFAAMGCVAPNAQHKVVAHVTPRDDPAVSAPGFVRVEGGTFQMGSDSGERREKPVHEVTVKSFSMSKYPVTQKEWSEIMGTTAQQQSNMAGGSLRGAGDDYPMYYVSWHEAIEYCNRRSQNEGLEPVYRMSGSNVEFDRSANGYRLPTEAEWEYAAKGGNKDYPASKYSGSNSIDAVAWYEGNSGGSTQPVGKKHANALGLHDMSGNVWEWCWDWFGNYPAGSQTDPAGSSSGRYCVVRGGNCFISALFSRSTDRSYFTPSNRRYYVGFRLVRS